MPEMTKPRQIMLSKRANIFYIEHVRVLQKDNRICYLTDRGEDLEYFFNIPERNTMLVLLGRGTSITDAAMRRMAESNVLVGFCGSGGSPLHMITEPVFMTPQSEYRPSEYMQQWVKKWFDEPVRLKMAKQLLRERIEWTRLAWTKNGVLSSRHVAIPDPLAQRFSERIEVAEDTTNLLLAEAEWAKALYKLLAQAFRISFTREEGERKLLSPAERVNSFLDHGNYIAYGMAAVTLNGLGISFAFPLLHGKTRRGALVFDVADMIKDAYVMPLAFECGASASCKENEFRGRLIETFHEVDVADKLFGFVKSMSLKVY